MPPILMLIAIVFVVGMVMFGNNPMDKWKAEAEKYGKDPLARQINKFNEERAKGGTVMTPYTPPPGATLYRLPPDQAQLPSAMNPYKLPGQEEKSIRPAPDIPMSQWGSQYPAYMLSPSQSGLSALPSTAMPNNVVMPALPGNTVMPRTVPQTSFVPGSGAPPGVAVPQQ